MCDNRKVGQCLRLPGPGQRKIGWFVRGAKRQASKGPQPDTQKGQIDLLFLGTGNAFAAEGSAFNSFLLNGRYLFDAGPTALQQASRGDVDPNGIDLILVSHFHADHFFGLPFLFLEYWRTGRSKDLYIAGPPGIELEAETLFEKGFPALPASPNAYKRRYIEVHDGIEAEAAGLQFSAAEVEHVPALRCFAYSAQVGGRSLLYSGDSKLCDGLLRLAQSADILVLDCSNGGDPVHMSREDVAVVREQAGPGARAILTHLDGIPAPNELPGVLVAEDLARFRL
jgi:ribonuclease BN (tRNA processing enzyme)